MRQHVSSEVVFQFQKPPERKEVSSKVNLVLGVGALAIGATRVERSLCDHFDGRPENDAEHSFMLSLIAPTLAQEYYPELNTGLISQYAVVHDLVEVYVGDTPTYVIDADGERAKKLREEAGLEKLKSDYSSSAPVFVRLLDAYEKQSDPESRFVRMVDKLMPSVQDAQKNNQELQAKYETPERIINRAHETYNKYIKDYPEFAQVLGLTNELAVVTADRFYTNS